MTFEEGNKTVMYACAIVLALFAAFAAYRENTAETIWYCFCIHNALKNAE